MTRPQGSGITGPMTWNVAKTSPLRLSGAIVLALLAFPVVVLSYTDSERTSLSAIRSVLVAVEAGSGPRVEASPYDVVIAVKLKLEQAGYRIVLDAEQRHDAVLLIEYEETPGREYPNLEIGTKIACTFTLYHPTVGKVSSHHLEAESAWPRPFGSLYWDAVQNLEENPYYYYLGDLFRGWLTSQTDVVDVFSAALREPPLFQSLDGSDNIVTSRMAANQSARLHAIHELGLRRDPRALDTLWRLVWEGNNPERKAAIAAIGEIGDPRSIERLKDLVAGGGPVGTSAAAALARIRASQ